MARRRHECELVMCRKHARHMECLLFSRLGQFNIGLLGLPRTCRNVPEMLVKISGLCAVCAVLLRWHLRSQHRPEQEPPLPLPGCHVDASAIRCMCLMVETGTVCHDLWRCIMHFQYGFP